MNVMRSSLILMVITGLLTVGAGPAQAASVLLAGGGSTSVEARLTGLGHTVTVSDETTWDSSFDYSVYDVVAFELSSFDPADIAHLVAAVDADEVGVVFFRGSGAEPTAVALGLITGSSLNWQTPTDVNIVDVSHPITQGLTLGAHSLGYSFMTYAEAPGANTTTLATGVNGSALVVHNTRRAVITPYYAHAGNHDLETATGLEITHQSILWAADPAVPVESRTWGSLKTLYSDSK